MISTRGSCRSSGPQQLSPTGGTAPKTAMEDDASVAGVFVEGEV